ncbi:MAG: hypothetical protein GF383_16865 [Candidatus Lokiarchaeota archaeon]|nr:hypothetical protein [Candidatus Lokiarchaeota archaeon]
MFRNPRDTVNTAEHRTQLGYQRISGLGTRHKADMPALLPPAHGPVDD